MTTVIPVIIFICICVFYALSKNYNKREDTVYSVYAGRSDEPHNESFANPVSKEKSIVIQLPDGTYANTHSFYRIRIDGRCMIPHGINHGEEWLAEKINAKKPVESQIKEGDVLLIFLSDTNRYKIRRVKRILDNNTLETYSYNQDGSEHISSRPHSMSSVLGVVKYRINAPIK